MLKIFCVEDNLQEIYLIKHFLKKNMDTSFELDHAPSLKESFEKLKEKDFDVVVLDLGLHDSVGLVTLTKFKEHCPNIPLIVYTGDNHEDIVQTMFKAGADAFISKNDGNPSELAEVLNLLNSIKN